MTVTAAQEKKYKRSIGGRLTLLIIFMIVIISAVTMIIGYVRFSEATREYYYQMGEITAGTIALNTDADAVERYSKTLTTDEEYEKTIDLLQKEKEECGAQALYIFTVSPEEDGIHYIFDTDSSDYATELGDFDPFQYIDEETGETMPLYPKDTEDQLIAGGQVDTIMGETYYGWTITVNYPLYGSDGLIKGYVGIDFDVNQVVSERQSYLWNLSIIILIVTAAFATIYLYIMRRSIIRPVNTMAKAANSFLAESLNNGEAIEDSGILSMEINTKDEMQSLSDALKSMVLKIQEHLTNLNIATIKSETDVLTSINNRGAFEQQTGAILRLRPDKDELDAFMMIDVDFFKNVNDTYGHAAGDAVLTECAHALKKIMREADVVGRLGGDEFAVFCKSIGSVEKAEEKAEQIRSEWLKIIPPGADKGITASIGISFAAQGGRNYEELFNKADGALYKAKEAGRDGHAVDATEV
jgi:diguanylate cyclase (GGDEF)-like protein